MKKNIFSILIAISTLFAACKDSAKQDSAAKNVSDNKADTILSLRHDDSLLHNHTGSNKASCCVGPPSRVKIQVDKK